MPRALKLSAAVGALALLTLAPKYLVGAEEIRADEQRLAQDMAALLRRNGFAARVVPHHVYAPVAAVRGSCRLLAADIDARGYLRARFERLSATIGPVRYQYGAVTSADFPRIGPVLADFAQRWLYRFGVPMARTPTIAVAASPGCTEMPAGWETLRLWPVRASPSAPGRS